MWDNDNTFSNRQTLAEGHSTHIVDTGGDDMGLGEPVYLQVSLTKGAVGDLTIVLEASADPGMTKAAKAVQYLVNAKTAAGGGTVLAAPLPTGCRRYLRLHYSGAVGGKIAAGLVQGAQTSGMR